MNRIHYAVFALVLSGVSMSSVAGEPSYEPSLYQRLGRLDTIISMVDDFAANLASDRRVNAHAIAADSEAWKEDLVRHICAAAGGPCKSGKSGDLFVTRANAEVSSRAALQANLLKTLHKFNVRGSERARILDIVAPAMTVSDATAWQ